jgi:fucose permease
MIRRLKPANAHGRKEGSKILVISFKWSARQKPTSFARNLLDGSLCGGAFVPNLVGFIHD